MKGRPRLPQMSTVLTYYCHFPSNTYITSVGVIFLIPIHSGSLAGNIIKKDAMYKGGETFALIAETMFRRDPKCTDDFRLGLPFVPRASSSRYFTCVPMTLNRFHLHDR